MKKTKRILIQTIAIILITAIFGSMASKEGNEMIAIVTSVDAYHHDYVQQKIDKLQGQDFDVVKVVRTEKMRFGIFGNDVTEIHYIKQSR